MNGAELNGREVRVGVLFGGRSGEHEVSLMSARTVMQALQQAGYETVPIGINRNGGWLVSGDPMQRLTDTVNAPELTDGNPPNSHTTNGAAPQLPAPLLNGEDRLPALDLIFPVLHGPFGEDGTVQGLLEMAGLPYVGSGVLASAAGMDKVTSKQLFAQASIPQANYHSFLRRQWRQHPDAIIAELEATLAYPMFVKPANLGSSVGISKAKDHKQLRRAIDTACAFDRKILVEQGVPAAREIEVSVLGNDDPIASVPGEVVPSNEFYDYEAKYLDDRSQLLVPAVLNADQVKEIQDLALRAFRVIDCAGLARVDFLLSGDGEVFLNEINTMPGFTPFSMFPSLWAATGLPYPELIDELVRLALARHAHRAPHRRQR
ncbi:MAG: D-alanine--D-alanine ligase [Caldilineaceae bacterium]|nr:D-alanine--D-alanine ligase [Caldilineaceae bacterium]